MGFGATIGAVFSSNVTTFTDTTATIDNTQTDTMAMLSSDPNNPGLFIPKAVYIAWNGNVVAPTTNPPANFVANQIMVSGSGDGGATWTAPQIVSNATGGYVQPPDPAAPAYSDPQVVFTQGSADGTVAGGQLVFVWNDFGNGTIEIDASQPDGGVATKVATGAVQVNGATGAITDGGVSIASATVAVVGATGYAVGAQFPLNLGLGQYAQPVSSPADQAQLKVATTNAGPPTTVATVTVPVPGDYEVPPPSPAGWSVGGGDATTFTLTTAANSVANTTTFLWPLPLLFPLASP